MDRHLLRERLGLLELLEEDPDEEDEEAELELDE